MTEKRIQELSDSLQKAGGRDPRQAEVIEALSELSRIKGAALGLPGIEERHARMQAACACNVRAQAEDQMTFEEFQKIEHRHDVDERCPYATRLRTLGDIEKYSACYARAHGDRAALIAEVKQLRTRIHHLSQERDARTCAADLLPRVFYK